ncbi:MAG: 50S ribosomal protein L4 [Nanoarchaeota archaeon]
MKVKVYNLEGKEVKEIELPSQFNEQVRKDLIRRAFLAIMSHKRVPYGPNPLAGFDVAWTSKRRRDYRSSYGRGISRIPRKILVRRGNQFIWVGAVVPNAVGGRRAHPPKVQRKYYEKINKKERRKAIRAAITATMIDYFVKNRGHKANSVVVVKEAEDIKKTKDFVELLKKLGFEKELERLEYKKIRAGKGKMRNRKYKRKVGPLVVISNKDSPLAKAALNVPGVDVVTPENLNVELLAPGGEPGRLTIWSEEAIKELKERNLFSN